MMTYTSAALQELEARGLIAQGTDLEALDAHLASGNRTFYIGYDATATSLHVGHLLTVMVCRILARHGHKPLIIMGGGTTKVGDPSFRDASRPMLNDAEIDANIQSIKGVYQRYLTFSAEGALMVNNNDWLASLTYLDFLRDYGVHFTINRMLTFESVRLRLERESPMTFLEFNYMLLQAYDFLELFRRHQCTLQLGGSDQWGNILNGVELVRKVTRNPVFGLTVPLITTSSGAKMGKTERGAVWLNRDLCSPFEFWQFWRNTEDADVVRFMKIYTDFPLEKIASFSNLTGEALNEVKIILADEVTRLLHGEEALQDVKRSIESLYGTHRDDLTVHGVDDRGNPLLRSSLPIHKMPWDALFDGVSLIEALTTTALATSNGEARRLIRGGGARLNNEKIADEDARIHVADLLPHHVVKLSAGKKKFAYIQFCAGES